MHKYSVKTPDGQIMHIESVNKLSDAELLEKANETYKDYMRYMDNPELFTKDVSVLGLEILSYNQSANIDTSNEDEYGDVELIKPKKATKTVAKSKPGISSESKPDTATDISFENVEKTKTELTSSEAFVTSGKVDSPSETITTSLFEKTAPLKNETAISQENEIQIPESTSLDGITIFLIILVFIGSGALAFWLKRNRDLNRDPLKRVNLKKF